MNTQIMSQIDIAWVAGIIEGEGYIRIPKTGFDPNIVVSMTDEDVIRRLQDVSGMGTINLITYKKEPHHKDTWRWGIYNRRDVIRLLCAIAPMMGERRRAKIAEAVERLNQIRRPVGGQRKFQCGTPGSAGEAWHRRRGEPPCEPCRLARNEYHSAGMRMKRKEEKQNG